MSLCSRKHTVPALIPNADFRCPKCDAECGVFCIDSSTSDDCDGLHGDDELRCYQCGHETTGRTFAAHYARKSGLVQCPTCKGSGCVTKKRAAGGEGRA